MAALGRQHSEFGVVGCTLSVAGSELRHADALDLPFQLDAGRFAHARTYGLAEGFDIGSGRMAEVDQKIAVHLRDLRAAHREPAATGGLDELPGLAAGRVLEGRAAGAALDRLGRL